MKSEPIPFPQPSRPDATPDGETDTITSVNGGLRITGLAEVPAKTLLDETALAKVLQVSKRTVRRMVGRFELPPPIKLRGRSMWFAGKVLDYLEARAERLARDAEKAAIKLSRLT